MTVTLLDVRAQMPGPPEPEPGGDVVITGVVVHHSQTVRREGQPYGSARTIFEYQIGHCGWETGGYHYVIGTSGQVEYALAEHRPGCCDLAPETAAPHAVHVCLIGWFTTGRTYLNPIGERSPIPDTNTQPAAAQWAALVDLLQWLRARHNLPPQAVRGHHEGEPGCGCPGPLLDLAALRAELAARPLPPAAPALQTAAAPAAAPAPSPTPEARRAAWLKPVIYGAQRWAVRLALVSAALAVVPAWRWRWWAGAALLPILAVGALVLALRWVNPPVWSFALYLQRMLRRAGRPTALRHTWRPLARLSPWLLRAVLATEDPHFFEHAGLALGHIVHVLRRNRGGVYFQGASTITQQLVKNLFLWPARSLPRKLLEGALAALVEACWPKARILEAYLNVVQLGVAVFGAEAASQAVWGQPAAALTLEQGALLAAVLSNPVLYAAHAPTREVLARRAIVRRNTLAYHSAALDRLLDQRQQPARGVRWAGVWRAWVLAYRVAALRLYLKTRGVYSRVNAHYRAAALAHRWSTAYHLGAGQITLGALRALPDGQDWDGTVWYRPEWDDGAPDERPAASVPALAEHAAALGPPGGHYAEEGYAEGDPRRWPNLAALPVSRHVRGQALDLAVDWAPLGGPWSDAAQALVARFGLARPVPEENWHLEARPGGGLGTSPLRLGAWSLRLAWRKLRRGLR